MADKDIQTTIRQATCALIIDPCHSQISLKINLDCLTNRLDAAIISNDVLLEADFSDVAIAPPIPTPSDGIQDVLVNDTSVVRTKTAYVSVPTKLSELVNDKGYASATEINTLINNEAIIREQADRILRATKQDQVEFITVPAAHGILSPADLTKVVNNKLSGLVYGNNVYYLSVINTPIRQYVANAAFLNNKDALNVIRLNIDTGSYELSTIRDQYVEEYIRNTIITSSPSRITNELFANSSSTIGDWASKGNATNPIYFDANGTP